MKRKQRVRRSALHGQDNEAALGCRYLLPKDGLAGLKVHLATELRRDRYLAALRDRGFHMMNLSCKSRPGNFFGIGTPVLYPRMDLSPCAFPAPRLDRALACRKIERTDRNGPILRAVRSDRGRLCHAGSLDTLFMVKKDSR